MDLDELRQQQHDDDCLREVILWLCDDRRRPPIGRLKRSSPTLRKLWHDFPKLLLWQGILCRKLEVSPHTPANFQVVLPTALISTALTGLHGNQFSGHLSAERTLRKARRICYWPYMTRDVYKFCAECLPCQSRNCPTPHERAPLQSIYAERPFQKVAADITELPITSSGNRYVLVVMDYFTKYVNLFSLTDQRATTVARCIFEEYIRHHGVPESIHTDQGRQFESDLMKHLCGLLGINKTRTSPYHAQSDGMVERLNRTLKDQLAKYMVETSGEWDQYLPQAELAYNSTVHSSTGFSPFFLVNGREPNLPLDILLNCCPTLTSSTPGTPAAYATHLATRLSCAFREAAHNSAANKQRQKTQYDKKVVFHPHQPGDLVLLDDPAHKMNKLAPRWKGPYVVLQRMNSNGYPGVTYEIKDPRSTGSRQWIVHHNRLKTYRGTLPTSSPVRQPPAAPAEVGTAPAPRLTALSGALPFRPPTPPHVPVDAGRQPTPTSIGGAIRRGIPSISPHSSPSTSSFPSPSVGPTTTGSLSQGPVGLTTRSGRQVKRPLRYGDCVT